MFKCVLLFCSCNICSVVDVSEGVCVFYEVLGEVGRFVGCSECILVIFEPCGKAPTGLSHIRLTTVGAYCIFLIVSACLKYIAYVPKTYPQQGYTVQVTFCSVATKALLINKCSAIY